MRNMSPRQLDEALRKGQVHEPVIILQPAPADGIVAGHFVPQGWMPEGTEPSEPRSPEPGELRLARMELETADLAVLLEDLDRRLTGRSVKPRSRWRQTALRRRTAWARLLDGTLPPDDNGGSDHG